MYSNRPIDLVLTFAHRPFAQQQSSNYLKQIQRVVDSQTLNQNIQTSKTLSQENNIDFSQITFSTMKNSKAKLQLPEENEEIVLPQSEQQEQELVQLQEDDHEEQEEPLSQKEDIQAEQDAEQYQQKQSNKGVCYLSRIPPYMKPNYIRKLLQNYMVERIYLLPESEWSRKNRIKRGGNKKICFREGWVEFADKRMAKLAALTLNGQKMVSKKGNFYSQDLWNLKYLPKFKWHHLTERLAHEQRLKKERLKVELQMERKVDQFYSQKLAKSKQINGIVQSKLKKGKTVKQSQKERSFQQAKMAPSIQDQQ